MTSLRVPAFKPHLQVEAITPDVVLLLVEGDVRWLSGKLYGSLAPLIDGRRTVDELIAALAGRHSAAEVLYGLQMLSTKGYLTEAEPGFDAAQAAFWHSLGIEPRQATAALAKATVEVLAIGEASTDPVIEALQTAGVRTSERGGDLTIAIVDDYLRAPLAELNQEALRSGRAWLVARLAGQTAWLGPRFVPGHSACWECLAHRLRTNRPTYALREAHRPGAPPLQPIRAAIESTLRTAAHLLVSSVARALAGGDDGLSDTLVTLDMVRLRTEQHAVTRRPQCPACGDPEVLAARQRGPVTLERRPVAFSGDGGHRIISPEETLRRYQHHISPLTGIVTQLVPVHSDELTQVIDSGHNLARRAEGPRFLLKMLRGRSTGKGVSAAQARASALCEAIERYCGAFQGNEARQRATLAELGGDGLHPHPLLGFSERQYRERQAWNATHGMRSQQIPHPFEEGRAVHWSPVWSLTHQTTRYVPTAFCYYDFREEGEPFCWADSNGCAAGNCLEEAVLQGFFEVAERDAVSLWWYNRVQRPRVDLETLDEPYVHRLADYYRRHGREFWVLDITCDLGVPTFAAVSRQTDRKPEQITLGFGSHLDARIAILRALTELNQSLPFVQRPAGTPEEPTDESQIDIVRWLETASAAEHPYLLPSAAPPVTADGYRRLAGADLREEAETCVGLAHRLGLETLVLDQTRPDVGLSVVKVIVPGLRHWWARFAPGRLYDVPVQLGWLPRPTPEEHLNPIPMFI